MRTAPAESRSVSESSYEQNDSAGISGVGTLPTRWTVKRLRTLCRQVTDGAHISPDISSSDFPFVSTVDIQRGEIDFDGCLRTSASSFAYMAKTGCCPRVGDVLFSKDGTVGKTAIVRHEREFAVASSLVILRPDEREIEPSYLEYWLNGDFIKQEVGVLLSGAALRRISVAKVGNLPVVLPPLPKQRAICTFLDRKTASIDALVAKKEQLIELLHEKRQALITQAVTKGLDPEVHMKELGISGIDRVPAHWRVERNKVFWREVNERSADGVEELLTVSHITGVTLRSEKSDVNMFLAETLEGYKRCAIDDLAINTMWAWMGALGVSTVDGIVSPSYNVYRLRSAKDHHARYFDLLYRTPPYVAEINRWSKGIWSSRLRLYPEEFLAMLSVAPPLDEQKRIVDYVVDTLAKDDGLLAVLMTSVERLREYRQALITAAVTGRLDVSAEAT